MDYVPVRVSTLRGDQKIDFDVYIKINDKMLLYLRRGDSFEGPRLSRLKAKKLKKMFIQPDDESAYRQYLHRNIEMAYDKSSEKDLATRAEIVHGDQQANAEQLFENPEAESVYQAAKDGAGRYVQFLLNENEAARAIFNAGDGDQSLSHHGVNVATLSVELGRRTGINDEKVVQLMTLGALIHDIGHQEATYSLTQNPSKYTPEELALYKEHPQAATKFQSLQHFDPLVTKIVAQHEECTDGSGFPLGLREKDMDPEVIVVAVANAIDRFITFEGVTRANAAKRMMMEKIGQYPLALIQQASEILKD